MSGSPKAKPGDGIRDIKSTNLFRLVNFELYAKPNMYVMGFGLVGIGLSTLYLAYLKATTVNADTYVAVNDDGTRSLIKRRSNWEWQNIWTLLLFKIYLRLQTLILQLGVLFKIYLRLLILSKNSLVIEKYYWEWPNLNKFIVQKFILGVTKFQHIYCSKFFTGSDQIWTHLLFTNSFKTVNFE